jgi:hypothetical protein
MFSRALQFIASCASAGAVVPDIKRSVASIRNVPGRCPDWLFGLLNPGRNLIDMIAPAFRKFMEPD